MSSTLTPPRDQSPVDSPPVSPPDRTSRRSRRSRPRWLRYVLGVFAVVLLGAAATAYWALDRFVIDHVEIADVSAYEAQARAEGEAVTVAASDDDTANDDDTVNDNDTVNDDDTVNDEDPVITETTYTSDSMTIEISTVTTGTGDDASTYYVADVTVADATTVRGGFAENQFGTNIVADTSDIAEYYDAVFAINGDYYGFRDSGIVIRNGVLFRDDGARTGLAMYVDGTMAIYDETTTTGEELLAAGVWNTISFGPALVDGGVIVDGIEDVEIDTNVGNHSIQGDQPRTGIGMIDENHFVFVVVDGRSSVSNGLTMTEFAQVFVDLGATVAYNLDGGGSSTMYFDGEVVNVPQGNGDERPTSDIVYLAES